MAVKAFTATAFADSVSLTGGLGELQRAWTEDRALTLALGEVVYWGQKELSLGEGDGECSTAALATGDRNRSSATVFLREENDW